MPSPCRGGPIESGEGTGKAAFLTISILSSKDVVVLSLEVLSAVVVDDFYGMVYRKAVPHHSLFYRILSDPCRKSSQHILFTRLMVR